jgi:hypothetical protein
LGGGRSSVGWVAVVAQWAKAPGIHCYVAGSIPAVTPRYCTKKIEKCSLEHKKTNEKCRNAGPFGIQSVRYRTEKN